MLHRSLTVAFMLWTLIALPAWAQSVETLARVLNLDEIIEIMRDEGKDYARELEIEVMPMGGGALWEQHVARVYNRRAMTKAVTDALEQTMTPEDIEKAIAFFDTDVGQEILACENAARRAMRDPMIEELSWQAYDNRPRHAKRSRALRRLVRVNDLLERNMAGALNASAQFYRGMTRGGALRMTEEDILSEVWAQEGELREDTEKWLFGFLNLAYQPLSDAVLEDYIAFSRTSAGQALNRGLFDGFDAMYRTISYRLGMGAALAMNGSDL